MQKLGGQVLSKRQYRENCLRTTLCPVTALVLLRNFVLAGQGNRLLVYGYETSTLLQNVQLFDSQTIHALILVDYHVQNKTQLLLACAGSVVRSVPLSSEDEFSDDIVIHVSSTPVTDCSHRILHVSFRPVAPTTEQIRIASILTAQNALLDLEIAWNCDTASSPRTYICAKRTSTPCLLLAGKSLWYDPDHVLVVAGTSFGKLLVWSGDEHYSTTNKHLARNNARQHCSIEAHEGAIFGVDVYHKTPVRTENCLFVVTCSDDRRIKVWNLNFVIRDQNSSATACLCESSSRGTLQNVPNEAANSLLVTQGWAHASRIWQVEFLKGRETSSTGLAGQILFSVGEDTSSELRLIEANDDDPRTETSLYECRRIAANSFHTGKNIWSYVIKGEARHVCSILTGGADGAIVVQQHRLDDISNEVENTQDVNISISEPLQVSSGDSLPFDPLHSRGPVDAASQPGALVRTTCDHDVFKSYCFSRKDSMIVVTRGGFMLEARLATDHLHYRTLVWRVIAHLKELSSFSVSAGIPKLRMTFHAGSNGDIYCVSGPQMRISHLVTIESKVTALFATPIQRFPDVYDDYNLEEHAPAAVLAETYIGSNSYKVRLYLLASDNSQPTFRGEFDLSMEKGFATSAILCIKGQSNCVTLFLGSRSGHLAVIDLQASAPDMQKRTLLSPSKTAKLHTDAITSMSWMPTATLEVSLTNGFLLSTSRDSSHMVHNIDLENGKDFAVPVHQSMLPLGPNIEGHFTDPRSGSQCFYGFSSRHLVVYDETNHLDIMRVDCGGAHRLWAFQPPCDKTTSFSATLVWTQASQLLWKPGQMPIVRSIRSGGHGREIKACAICPRMLEGRDVLLATGAEDTDIRIFRYRKAMRHDMSEDLKCLRVIKRHNTGIQCLRWSTNGEYLFSSGGREEFFIWRIRQLPLIGVGVVCESVLPPLDELSDLRITSFDVEVTHDTGLDGREKGMTMLFYMTLSNSSVRIYTYATQKRQWNLKCLNVYSTCCLSTANLLDTKPSTTLPWILITGGTDGRLTFWDLSLSPSRTSEGDSTIGRRSLRVHQSMIKDVSIAKVSSPDLDVKHYLLASGGDDNSLALTLIALSGNETEVAGNRATGHTLACTTVLIPKAHAAAIAGVALFNSMTEEVDTTSSTLQYFKLVSTANDQKIKTWRVTVDQSRKGAEAIQIFKDRTVHTPVADVACLTRLPSPDPESTVELAQVGEDGIRVIVCGAGMDIVKIGS